MAALRLAPAPVVPVPAVPVPAAAAPPAARAPYVYSVPVGVLAAAVVLPLVLLVAVLVRPVAGGPPVSAAAPPHAVASPPAVASPVSARPAVEETAAEAAGQADLRAVAARLPASLALRSPAGWDRWLPAGKRYPGASTAEDVATCPHLADALGTALGTRLSYWTGTLPNGPQGCTWATVPLSYRGPYSYPYLLDLGYLADGSTAADWRDHLTAGQAGACTSADLPAAGAGAVLVRCADAGQPAWTLVLPDTRRAGLWFLGAQEQTAAPHPSSDALVALVSAVQGVYGRAVARSAGPAGE
jgi:hypothetical protein